MNALERLKFVPLLIVALLWEGAVRTGIISSDLLPSLVAVWAAFVDLLRSGMLLENLAATLFRALLGLLSGIVVGVLLGVVMAQYRRAESFLNPLVTATYPLPKSTLIPLTIMWFGIGHFSKVLVIFLGCLAPMVIHTYHGARGVDRQLIWSAQSLGTSRQDLLKKIIIPAALPHILTGIRIAIGFSFLIVIGAEMVASRIGVGHLILEYGEGAIYDFMFAVVFTIVALALAVDRGYMLLARRYLRWFEEGG